MKLYLSQINQLFDGIANKQVKALLLYGPDKGYIDKICKTLIKKFDLLKTSIEYSEIKAQSLKTLIDTPNLFGQKQLIMVRSVGESIDKSLKLALNQDALHFLVFIADELSANSSIRKFFEMEDYLVSVACYHDDEQQIAKIILQKSHKIGKTITKEALDYLTSSLKGDHQTLINELNKLWYFTIDQNHITLDDVQRVISDNFTGSGDNLCMYFVAKDINKFLQEFSKLKEQNINEILMIRALIRYYINLYIVLTKLEIGINLDAAIKSLPQPIFYKNIPAFKKTISEINLQNCIKMLKHLQQAEVDYKLNPKGFDIYQQVVKFL